MTLGFVCYQRASLQISEDFLLKDFVYFWKSDASFTSAFCFLMTFSSFVTLKNCFLRSPIQSLSFFLFHSRLSYLFSFLSRFLSGCFSFLLTNFCFGSLHPYSDLKKPYVKVFNFFSLILGGSLCLYIGFTSCNVAKLSLLLFQASLSLALGVFTGGSMSKSGVTVVVPLAWVRRLVSILSGLLWFCSGVP